MYLFSSPLLLEDLKDMIFITRCCSGFICLVSLVAEGFLIVSPQSDGAVDHMSPCGHLVAEGERRRNSGGSSGWHWGPADKRGVAQGPPRQQVGGRRRRRRWWRWW